MNAESFVPLQAQPGGGFDFSFFLMMGAIFFIFYMLVIRPQQRQQKEREAHLRTAAKGDEVVTAGGVHGKVAAVDGEVLEIEVANRWPNRLLGDQQPPDERARTVQWDSGLLEGREYETVWALGAACGVDDLAAILN